MQHSPDWKSAYRPREAFRPDDSRSILGAELTRVEQTLEENASAGAIPGYRPVANGSAATKRT